MFEGDFKLNYHMAPPLVAKRNDKGELQKQKFGPAMLTAFRVLARLKGLRGTFWDVFGRTEERRTERALMGDYMASIDEVLATLDATNLDAAVAIARIPEQIRGYGHVKARHLAAARVSWKDAMDQWRAPVPARQELTERSVSEALKVIGCPCGVRAAAASQACSRAWICSGVPMFVLDDEMLQRVQPVFVIRAAVVHRAAFLRASDLAGQRGGPLRPGENATLVQQQRQPEGMRLPGCIEGARRCAARRQWQTLATVVGTGAGDLLQGEAVGHPGSFAPACGVAASR